MALFRTTTAAPHKPVSGHSFLNYQLNYSRSDSTYPLISGATPNRTHQVDHKGTLVDEQEDVSGQAVSMVLSDSIIPFPPPDPTLSISISTNGLPRLEWEAVPGVVQTVLSSDNLVIPSQWAARPDSTQSILRVENEWIDPAGFSNPARFYKIQEIE